jgi:hypothetical protein
MDAKEVAECLLICTVSCSKLGHFATQHGKLFMIFEEAAKVAPLISYRNVMGAGTTPESLRTPTSDTPIRSRIGMEAEIASARPTPANWRIAAGLAPPCCKCLVSRPCRRR